MKKNIFIMILSFLFIFGLSAQTVEKLVRTEEIKLKVKIVNVMPEGIMVDEKNDDIYLINGGSGGSWIYNCENNFILFDKNVPILNGVERVKLNEYLISYFDTGVFIDNTKGEDIANLNNKLQSGISFILKKGSGYIVYYVDKNGIPGAVDTEGKIYTNKEAVEYLKQYDSDKYEESLSRAEELGLKYAFKNAEVLVWGKTYYSTIKNMQNVYGEIPYIRTSDLIQYDLKGYGYEFQDYLKGSEICIVSPEGKRLNLFSISEPSTIYSTYTWEQDHSSSWYVGFGGNIYYYVAGSKFTEVFRIRRTWGDPDFYAMAINGYTEDEYGKYVDKVIPTLSKADLRLLRNTIFALYGVHFKSEDLAKHFDKQVWYTDEGKTSALVQLPAHRQALLEKIQALEK